MDAFEHFSRPASFGGLGEEARLVAQEISRPQITPATVPRVSFEGQQQLLPSNALIRI
ncbi:MAG: hypothetical protein U1D55_15200 [Phycisphaerae bacterium]